MKQVIENIIKNTVNHPMKVAYKKYRKKYYKDTIDRIYSKEIVFYINLKKVFYLEKYILNNF